MKKFYGLLCLLLGFHFSTLAQTSNLHSEFGLTELRCQQFSVYLYFTHGEMQFEAFKTNDPVRYYTELWVISESFYVRKDEFATGVELDETIIDIRRFEQYRLADTEAIVPLEGFKDALILKPLSTVNQAKQQIHHYFN